MNVWRRLVVSYFLPVLAVPVVVLALSVGSTALAQSTGVSITDLPPGNGSFLATKNLTLKAAITENGNAVDPSKITLLIDNENHGAVSYDAVTKIASRAVVIGDGTHTVLFRVINGSGATVEKSYVVTVDTVAPTVSVAVAKNVAKTGQLATTVNLSVADDPAGRASGVFEMRVAFDGVLDNESWEPFQPTFTRDLMNKEGLQAIAVRVRDRAGNISAVATTTTTLELTPNVKPTTTLSSTVLMPTGNQVTITWDAVPTATGYLVRYSDGQILFGPFQTTNSFMTFANLDPKKTFMFEVAEINPAGSISEFSKVLTPELAQAAAIAAAAATPSPAPSPTVTPTATTSTTSTAKPKSSKTTKATPSPTATPSVTAKVSPSPTPTPVASPSPTISPSPATSSGTTNQPRDWTRVIVALSILIIAAGVATGGWYLYQWWMTRPAGGGKGKGGRW